MESANTIPEKLVDWYKQNARDLPWRRVQDPYKIWVSEIMLQQTQVDTVIPYYNRFIEKFPTVEALARAEEDDVIKAWEGLGYYSRARNLHSAVREVTAAYDGVVPDNKEDISGLKGVGPYTAGAVLSIAYGKSEPAVDGNVMRVISRLFALRDDIARPATRKRMENLVRQLIPRDDPSAFNQGLMELGATVCTPRKPDCLLCPLRDDCMGRAQGIQENLPVKKRKKPVRRVPLVVGVIIQNNHVLLRRRDDHGLLARMWEFPNSEGTDITQLLADYDMTWGEALGTVSHTFTHLKWEATVYPGTQLTSFIQKSPRPLPPKCCWVALDDLGAFTLPNVFHKVRKLAGI